MTGNASRVGSQAAAPLGSRSASPCAPGGLGALQGRWELSPGAHPGVLGMLPQPRGQWGQSSGSVSPGFNNHGRTGTAPRVDVPGS